MFLRTFTTNASFEAINDSIRLLRNLYGKNIPQILYQKKGKMQAFLRVYLPRLKPWASNALYGDNIQLNSIIQSDNNNSLGKISDLKIDYFVPVQDKLFEPNTVGNSSYKSRI